MKWETSSMIWRQVCLSFYFKCIIGLHRSCQDQEEIGDPKHATLARSRPLCGWLQDCIQSMTSRILQEVRHESEIPTRNATNVEELLPSCAASPFSCATSESLDGGVTGVDTPSSSSLWSEMSSQKPMDFEAYDPKSQRLCSRQWRHGNCTIDLKADQKVGRLRPPCMDPNLLILIPIYNGRRQLESCYICQTHLWQHWA